MHIVAVVLYNGVGESCSIRHNQILCDSTKPGWKMTRITHNPFRLDQFITGFHPEPEAPPSDDGASLQTKDAPVTLKSIQDVVLKF